MKLQIVRVEGGWYARGIARNGRIVWVTPGLYDRKKTAKRAIDILKETVDGCAIEEVDERGVDGSDK